MYAEFFVCYTLHYPQLILNANETEQCCIIRFYYRINKKLYITQPFQKTNYLSKLGRRSKKLHICFSEKFVAQIILYVLIHKNLGMQALHI